MTQPAGSSVTSAVRTYSAAGGKPVVERSATSGVAGTTLTWLFAGLDGTVDTQTDARTGATSRQYRDPFGVPIGGASGVWGDGTGFLGKPVTASSKLTTVGARTYDPILGKFASVDPVVDPNLPQQNFGYAYSGNNPVTFSDPTGLRLDEGCGWGRTCAAAAARGSIGTPTKANTPGLSNQPRKLSEAKAPKPYDYRLTYPIKASGLSDAQIWRTINPRLGSLFPLPGMVNSPKVGQKLTLAFASPVEVTETTGTSFSLTSLPGHVEGPNNHITFTVSDSTLIINATGPVAASPPASYIPDIIWPLFATNINAELNPDEYNVPATGWRH